MSRDWVSRYHNYRSKYTGLSYTTFKLTDIDFAVTSDSLNSDEPANSKRLYDGVAWVNVEVCNTGDVYGTEIAQLYVGSPAEGAPVKVLRGFEAVHLHPGETKTVTFELTRRDLRYVQPWTVSLSLGRADDVATGTYTSPAGPCRKASTESTSAILAATSNSRATSPWLCTSLWVSLAPTVRSTERHNRLSQLLEGSRHTEKIE